MEPVRGHAAAFQQHQLVQRQNQIYQQQQQQQQSRRQRYNQGQAPQQGQDYMSVGSHYSRESSRSGASSQVDEAFQRVGLKLSIRAHGDGPIVQPKRLSRIGLTNASIFTPYAEEDSTGSSQQDGKGQDITPGSSTGATSTSTPMDRTAKVAKKRYSDHGDHHHSKVPPRNGNILRKMTINATDLFRTWQSDFSRRNKKRSSPKTTAESRREGNKANGGQLATSAANLSPHNFAFSQLALGGSSLPQTSQHPHDMLPPNLIGGGSQPNEKGLSAVMESSSSHASSQSTTPNSHQSASRSRGSSTLPRSETRSTRSLPPGKCLTQPSEAVANNGLDNIEGNLIAHENDAISVSRKQIHVLIKEKMNVKRADFRIQGLLGQGTFAQVFQCVHVQTGNLVAIKIVKNKPAYTRQAAVEIDIFRALTKSNTDQAISSSTLSCDAASTSSRNGEGKFDHMVDLVCYFMHQGHLCLVFELLGLNLYEVLKKRQFRGLPLSVVRVLVKQAVLGIKELAKKNIVHCDLKPENILLISEDDVDSVVSAGESRRSSARSVSSMEKRGSTNREPPSSTDSKVKILGSTPVTSSSDLMSGSPANSLGTNGSTITAGHSLAGQKIKLIDFGSACFEGQSTHTYIQSRFYRSPEVLIGLPYDSAIDLWSLGCVAAELFLGLPILPGVHEHDQLCRICEMISGPSDWMLEQGSKSTKFFTKSLPTKGSPTEGFPQWRLRTQQEYIEGLSASEIRKKGGLEKLEKQPANRYFKRKRLDEIIVHKGQSGSPEDKDNLDLFTHFLYGILDPDPWKRWTGLQAAQHPFLTGASFVRRQDQTKEIHLRKDENQANIMCDIYWEPPLDSNICRRKLLIVQKTREMQQTSRRGRGAQPRSVSVNSHEAVATQMNGPSTHSNARGLPLSQQHQGIGARLANDGYGGTMSASYTGLADASNGNGGTDTGSVVSAGQQTYASGPFSYSEIGYPTGFLQNSLNEVDFAYALQRPGVVPMGGDSVASASVDLSTVASVSQLRQNTNHNQVQTNTFRANSGKESQSYSDVLESSSARNSQAFTTGSVGTAPGYLGHQMPEYPHMKNSPSNEASSSMGPHANLSNLPHHTASFMSSGGQQAVLMQGLGDPILLQQQDATSLANSLHEQLVYDNAQVYLQQQHVALQQQQMMLQQQQAALALRQQQLQVYGFAPGAVGFGVQGGQMGSDSIAAQQLGGTMNPYSQSAGGYYYVTAADGSQVMVSAAGIPNQGAGMDPRMFQDPSRYPNG